MSIILINASINSLVVERQTITKELNEIKAIQSTILEKINVLEIGKDRPSVCSIEKSVPRGFADIIKDAQKKFN